VSLVGNLRDLSITNLMQVICAQRRRVRLNLSNGTEQGWVIFDNGEVIHAEVDGVHGEDAVLRLLDWDEGHFSTTDEVMFAHRTVKVPWDKLVTDALERLSELEIANEYIEPARKLSDREIEHDNFLENDMMLFLSQLEQTQSQIKEGKVRKPTAVLEVLVQMANKSLDFFDKTVHRRSGEASLRKELTRHVTRYSVARWLQTNDGRYSSKSANEILKRSESAERFQVFADLCLSIIGTMDSVFRVLVTCFNAKTTAKEINEACNLYLHDLNATISEIKV